MVIAYSAVLGLLIGSFLTVVVDRVPRRVSIVAPGSACGACGLRLGPLDLVPVVSWVALRGKCRSCRTPIGIEPILVELATAGLFVAMAVEFGLSWELVAYCVLSAGLVALSVIDLKTQRLPREITYVTMAIGAPLLVVAALVAGEPERIWMAALGAVIYVALMGLIYLASRGGMGDGDVRFSPLLGMYLGWVNPGLVPVSLFLASIVGSVVGITMMLLGRGGRKTAIPFGPFLAAGTIAAVFVGQDLLDLVMAR
jgi:leader peptidase (prepilin peptidase)/N-methyltransferase